MTFKICHVTIKKLHQTTPFYTTLKNGKSNLLSRKNLNQKSSRFQYYVVCQYYIEKFKMLLECSLPYTHPIAYPRCTDSGIQTTVELTFICHDCVDIASIIVSWQTCYNLVKVLSTEFLQTGQYLVKAIFSHFNPQSDVV